MKKKSLLLTGIMLGLAALSLTGCSGSTQAKNETIKIGINQLAEHPALDQVREGFIAGLEDLEDLEMDFKNAQGDIPNAISISQNFVDQKSDLIFSIGTAAAQASKQVGADTNIIFSAVTDPIEAGLVESLAKPGGRITGTSDESPVKKQLELFKALDPNIKRIGIIYNTGEANSQVQIDKAKLVAKELGLEIETIGVSNINDIAQAVDVIIPKVDAIYTITDNMVASAINLVAEKATAKGMITIGAEESHVAGGILLTDGLSYFKLGQQSAEMAKKILIDKVDIGTIACEKALDTDKTFNSKTLEKLNLDMDNPAFKDAQKID